MNAGQSGTSPVTENLHGTYSIGDFARLSGVTAKALRHYDRIGVLHPAVIDAHNRYRRYSAGQLAELYELLSFTRLGLSLRQARDVMAREAAGDSVTRALLTARREIEARVAEDIARLAWIRSKLDELCGDVDGSPASAHSSVAVVLKEQKPLRVMGVRDRLGTYDDADALLDDLTTDAASVASLSCLRGTVWHDCGQETGVIDCEAIVLAETAPRRRPRPRGRGGRVRDLPGATLACVIHRGSDESVGSTYAAVRRWIAAHGFAVVGPNREWYLGGATSEPVMEIQFPIRRGWR
jgi:DNA-binding transcriptional MerR regulator